MSTVHPDHPSSGQPIVPEQRELHIYSHSALFYWWPVWAVGFLMALLTLIDNHRMALVPADTKAEHSREVEGHQGKTDVLVVPNGKQLPVVEGEGEPVQPRLHMANSKNLGVLFATVLLLIIVISNVPLRGLWSFVILLFIGMVVLILALADLWGKLVDKFQLLDIRINLGGYLFISGVLFIIWAVTVFVFDRRQYVVVTPGQVRVCQAVGTSEQVFNSNSIRFEKQQNDLFRHWIVGLGSGDLIMHELSSKHDIDMPNVLFIGSKVKEIDAMLKEQVVV